MFYFIMHSKYMVGREELFFLNVALSSSIVDSITQEFNWQLVQHTRRLVIIERGCTRDNAAMLQGGLHAMLQLVMCADLPGWLRRDGDDWKRFIEGLFARICRCRFNVTFLLKTIRVCK